MSYKILLVDDNRNHLESAEFLLQSRGYRNIETALSGIEAIERVKANPWRYGLVILDYHMNDLDGAETAKAILSCSPNLYILFHSGDETQQVVIRVIDAGAVGFIPKSNDPEEYLEKVALWCKKYEQTYLPVSPNYSASEYSAIIRSVGLIGASKGLSDVVLQAKRYAPLKDTVLIEGETGTGKERIARILHQGSPRLYFPVNCAAFNGPIELMESDLFGHLKGTFTGADSNKMGLLRSAQGGTVVLDEIDTLSLQAQQKLLRALREMKVRPLGSDSEFPIECRFVVTAKPGLEKRAVEGKVMEDFFERIHVLRIQIPPLRERADDIVPLVAHFCELYEKETGRKKRFLPQTLDYLKRYDWLRNIAQLDHEVRRLCVDTDGDTILPKHLGEEFFKEQKLIPLSYQLKNIAKEEMLEAVKRAQSRREASRILGIPETTLRRKLKEFEIADPFVENREGVN
jgi:DNA-binding NtrC family response regulator